MKLRTKVVAAMVVRGPRGGVAQVRNEQRPPHCALRAQGLGGDKARPRQGPHTHAHKSELWPLFKDAKATSKRTFWHTTELFINGI